MKVNTTIDNVSPAITYTSGWTAGTHSDTSWTQYYLTTYMMCSKLGENATFTFNGTGVWLYGALRSDHGLYNVTLDGTTTTHDGFAAGSGLFQQVLFGASDLASGPHTIILTNNRNSSTYANLDLDFITWQEDLGDDNAGDTLNNVTEDDNASSFTYGPAATAWSTVPTNLAQYHGSTGHTTVSAGAYVTYTFIGSAVSIYGALGPSQGPYSVSLDGGAAANYTALNTDFFPQQLLYHATDLDNTTHTVQINNMPARTGQALDIDYAVFTEVQAPIVTTTSTSAISTSSSTTSTSSIDTSLPTVTAPAEKKSSVSTGVVVAAVVGGLALLAFLSFILMMFRRRQKAKHDQDDPDMITVYPEPYSIGHDEFNGGPGRYIPPSQNMQDGYNPLVSSNSNGSNSAPLYPPSRGPYDQYGYSSRQEYFPSPQQADGASLFSGLAPAMPQQGVGRPRLDSSSTGHGYASDLASTAPYGRDSAYTGVSNGSSRMPAHGHSTIGGPDYNAPLPPIPPLPNRNSNLPPVPLSLHQAPPTAPGLIPPRKGQVNLPPSAAADQQEEFRGVPRDELSTRRMNVEGREQDFGPVLVVDDPLHVSQAALPPNYDQATETFRR